MMDKRFNSLLNAFKCSANPEPANLAFSIGELPESGTLPSPWETWLLIGLARHRERQLWVADIIQNRLCANLNRLAVIGALGHPEGVPQLGPVPGMSEWEYYFHGRGCCISHKVDGDAIDVDFYGDTAEYFDTYFYKNYLISLRRPELPEQRLRELYPSACAITIGITNLLKAGPLTPLKGRDSHPYRLADESIAALDHIESFCTAWADRERRVWLASLIGDWIAADEAANGIPELTTVTAPRARKCLELWWSHLSGLMGVPFFEADALHAMADLKAPDLDKHLKVALCGPGPFSGLTSTALDVVGKLGDSKWCDTVHELFSRVNPSGELPQPHIWITSLKFLLQQKYRVKEVVGDLSMAGRNVIGEAVLLSLEHAPELALPLIRKGLIAEVPIRPLKNSHCKRFSSR